MPPIRQQRRPSVAQLLDRERSALDALCADVAAGARHQGDYDALEERGHAIASGIRRAFRGERR